MNLTSHRSRHIDEVTLEQFDVVIALDPIVYTRLRELCPVPPPAILSWPLDDPYMQGLDAYYQCLIELQATIESYPPQLLKG